MSPAQAPWDSTESTERPMSLALRLSNSGLALEKAPSSVVQTGVKSLGWEKRTPQLSPSHSWKLMVPSVVSAVKSGAVSPSRTAMEWSSCCSGLCDPPTITERNPIVDQLGQDFEGDPPAHRGYRVADSR